MGSTFHAVGARLCLGELINVCLDENFLHKDEHQSCVDTPKERQLSWRVTMHLEEDPLYLRAQFKLDGCQLSR